MLPIYEQVDEPLNIYIHKSAHIPPHLHKAIECVLVTNGTLELGVGVELFHMEKGDFAMVFPELIHHYQVFDTGKCTAMKLLIAPSLAGPFGPMIQQLCPENPVIPKDKLHPDIAYVLESLRKNPGGAQKNVLYQAFTQIILARGIDSCQMVGKSSIGSHDIIYQTVSYIAAHFREPVTLTGMAHDLGYSPYVLSRTFSGTFHRNFNQYLNEIRLDYACSLLLYSEQSITEVCGNAGFGSQRTFNRVFMERYHTTPQQYRKQRETLLLEDESMSYS